MRTCFEIAIYTGCRVSERNMPLRDFDLEARTITLEKQKGGAEPAFTVPMREELEPFFTRLKQERTDDQTAYDLMCRLRSGKTIATFPQLKTFVAGFAGALLHRTASLLCPSASV